MERVTRATPAVAVVTFPGSNDDGDARLALEALGAEAVASGTPTRSCPVTGGVVLPGGFSYGDYLRCGAIARFAPVMDAVRRFAAAGGPVLGICNGFQILCEAGLLPGVLRPNRQLEFVCRDVASARRARRTPVHRTCEPGQRAASSRSSTARATGTRRRRSSPSWRRAARSCCATWRTSTARVGRRRGRRERRRQRPRPDAPSRARGRSAPRPDRRRPAARGA